MINFKPVLCFNESPTGYVYKKGGQYLAVKWVREFGRKPYLDYVYTEDYSFASVFEKEITTEDYDLFGNIDVSAVFENCEVYELSNLTTK